VGGLPELWVVVVAYGAVDQLERMLEGLHGAYPVHVVDNGSSPTTRALAERHRATYVDPGRNLGFAAGVNRALLEMPADSDVLLVNPDAEVAPATIEQMRRALVTDPRASCVAPLLVDPESGHPEPAGWPFPGPSRAWLSALGLDRLRHRCDFVSGAVLLLSGHALQDVGYLDERFFLYAEEVDWQFRAHREGWHSRCLTQLRATHRGAGTEGDADWREAMFHCSYERYIRKWYGTTGWWVCRSAAIVGNAWRALALPDGRARSARQRLKTYWQGPEAHLAALQG
jgi:GT2 family glycosyltransferase